MVETEDEEVRKKTLSKLMETFFSPILALFHVKSDQKNKLNDILRGFCALHDDKIKQRDL